MFIVDVFLDRRDLRFKSNKNHNITTKMVCLI